MPVAGHGSTAICAGTLLRRDRGLLADAVGVPIMLPAEDRAARRTVGAAADSVRLALATPVAETRPVNPVPEAEQS